MNAATFPIFSIQIKVTDTAENEHHFKDTLFKIETDNEDDEDKTIFKCNGNGVVYGIPSKIKVYISDKRIFNDDQFVLFEELLTKNTISFNSNFYNNLKND